MNDIYFNIFFQYILCFNIFYKNYKCFLLSCRLKRFQVMNIYCQASKFYGNKRFGTAEVSWGNLRKRFIDIVRIPPFPPPTHKFIFQLMNTFLLRQSFLKIIFSIKVKQCGFLSDFYQHKVPELILYMDYFSSL